MRHSSNAATHLQGVTFKIVYPSSPFYPAVPVFAPFSGVLNASGQLHARLDTGSIPGPPTSTGIPIRGSFSLGPDETPMSFSGVLSNNRITGEAQLSEDWAGD